LTREPHRLLAGDPIPILVLFVLTVTVYLPSVGFDLVYDDARFIAANPRIREIGNPLDFFTDPSTADPGGGWSGIYRPLRTLSFALDTRLFGGRSAGYHLVNVLLHTANVLLLYAVMRRIVEGRIVPLLTSVLFAVHPAGVEAVAWASSRDNGLFLLFFLAALWVHLRGGRGFGSILALGLFSALAFLSKETAIVLLPLLFVHDVTVGGKGLALGAALRAAVSRRWRSYVAAGVALGASLVLRFAVMGPEWGQRGIAWGGSSAVTRLTAVSALGPYALRTVIPFLPAPFTFDWDLPLVESPADLRFLVPLAVAVAVVAASLYFRRTRPRPAFFVLWFFLGLLPTSSLLVPINIFFADRFLYLAMIGPLALLALGLVEAARRRPIFAPVLVCVPILVCLMLTESNLAAWRSPLSLWGRVVRRSLPHPHPRALHGYAEALARIPSRRAEAIACLRAALDLEPDYTTARGSLGTLLALEGRRDEAVREFRTLVERAEARGVDPGNRSDYVRACSLLADYYAGAREGREAIRFAEKLLAFEPRDPELRHLIGELYLEIGNLPIAKLYFQEALRLDPDYAPSDRALRDLDGDGFPPHPR